MIFSIDRPERRSRVALIDGASGAHWTYGDLEREIGERQKLLPAGKSLLFLFCRNDPDSAAWYLAAADAGHAAALLNDRLAGEDRANLISRYRPDLVLSSQPLEDPAYRPCGSAGLWRRNGPEESGLYPDLSLLLSTSGSTGSPKFVRLTRGNVEANAASIRQALGIREDHLPVAHLPLYYSYGLSILNSHLLAGGTILLTGEAMVTSGFWAAIRKYGANSFSGVPYTYQLLRRLDLDKLDVPSIRTMTQAGGKLDTNSIAWFHERMAARGGSFWVMYGQTEATARITILPAADLPRKPGSAGRAIPGGRLSIRTESGEVTTAGGVEGELIYHGPNVMLGYAVGREDLSRADELGGCLHTGDRASLDGEGYVYILGRGKRDAKLFGHRVNLDEIEAFVKQRGPAAVIAGGEGVVVFCEFGDEAQLAGVREELAARLKIHRSAFAFRRIQRLPTADSGKISYEALQALV